MPIRSLEASTPEARRFIGRLGEVIRRHRVVLGISQRELGERCGYSQPAISEIELGGYQPTLYQFTLIADALDADAGELLLEAAE